MIVLAGFLLLFIIFIFSVFYGTLQEGFEVNDYHWAKNQYGEWVLQKRDADTNVVNEDEFQDELSKLSLEDIPADGVIPEGYIKFGEKMMKLPEDVQQDMIEQQIVEKKPLIKEPIPDSGILSRGYYKINQFEMAAIPDAYYIYDKDTMAAIPDGYQASEDKTYLFRTSDELQNQINRADSYSASDFSAYRDSNSLTTTDPNTSATQPASRDPRQFLLDGQDTSMTSDATYINTVIDQENPALRERGTPEAGSDYRASPSYSFYDNHTIINTTNLKNTPGMLGGFCTQNAHSQVEIEKKCSKLDKDICASTNCCVLLGNESCVAGNEQGPSYQDHYRNPLNRNRDYYYYKGKCYGNCKHH